MKVNILLVIVVILLLCKIVDGYKKGMVKEIVSLISLIVLCIVAALGISGLKSYLHGEVLNTGLAVLILIVLSIAHRLLNIILFPAKLFSKLPIIHGVDKLLGALFGVLETVLFLWTFYAFVMMLDTGMLGTFIRECTVETPILKWLYEHNQLAAWIEQAIR